MAQEWCVNYGVLSHEDASKLHKKIMKRKGKPIKSTSAGTSSSPGKSSNNLKKKKKVKVESDEAVDVGLNADGGEGIGMVTM